MTKYVVGFLFNQGASKVVLIKKNRPDWQKGLLNGVGGHIEENETPIKAMIREFKEETGVLICHWMEFAVLKGNDYEVYFFYAFSTQTDDVKTTTDEEIIVLNLYDLYYSPIIYNLGWLIPMCLDSSHKHSDIECLN